MKERIQVRISDKVLKRFRLRVRVITSRVRRVPKSTLVSELYRYMAGWAGHYARFPGTETQLKDLDGWVRRRLRQWLWVEWKTVGNRRHHLRRGGAKPCDIDRAVHIRSAWRVSTHPALNVCVSNARIAKAGLRPLISFWQRFALL